MIILIKHLLICSLEKVKAIYYIFFKIIICLNIMSYIKMMINHIFMLLLHKYIHRIM